MSNSFQCYVLRRRVIDTQEGLGKYLINVYVNEGTKT